MLRKLFNKNRSTETTYYPINSDDPYKDGHELLNQLFKEVYNDLESFSKEAHVTNYMCYEVKDCHSYKTIFESSIDMQRSVFVAILPRRDYKCSSWYSYDFPSGREIIDKEKAFENTWNRILTELWNRLSRRDLSESRCEYKSILRHIVSTWKYTNRLAIGFFVNRLIKSYGIEDPPGDIVKALAKLNRLLKRDPYDKHLKLIQKINSFISKQDGVESGKEVDFGKDSLAIALRHVLNNRETGYSGCWREVCRHILTAHSASKPTQKWIKGLKAHMELLPESEVVSLLNQCLASSVKEFKSADIPFYGQSIELLKGIIWSCILYNNQELLDKLRDVTVCCFRKIPDHGAVSVKAGNACIMVLGKIGTLESVSLLSQIKTRIKYPSAQKFIEKMLKNAADQMGITSIDLEELAVPAFGLNSEGKYYQSMEDVTAEIEVINTIKPNLKWIKSNGKAQKTVPKHIKENHADDLKLLRSKVKNIGSQLASQKVRIENLLSLDHTWAYSVWKERYLEHGLVGILTRRLIWAFKIEDNWNSGFWYDGHIVDSNLKHIEGITKKTLIKLWHPICHTVDEIELWRNFLNQHEITQPFKQAHREIYLLTDAEQQTGIYSNRFAAHILKQHQFAALCKARGWTYRLMGQFDSHNTPFKKLEKWNVTAEFWVDPMANVEISEAGIDLYIATDQVRFVGVDRQPMALQDVPALVFSEVMRDVDLFVGVCSVGNDPNWADGGPDGRYRDYWHSYSFGDLSESAKTRKAVFENLIPRLKIADRCRFEEKFLVVRGDIRTYKIHMGSGNIMMEPNDQYLCIVPGRSAANVRGGKVFLPFEGDKTLSIILSKALLLAEDKKIKDITILNQIRK